MDEPKGMLATLFDFSFTEFITSKLVKLLFVIGIVFAVIGAIAFISAGFQAGAGWGILALLVSPVVFLIYVLLVRVYLEIIIVIFRIAEHVHLIAKSKSEPEVIVETDYAPGHGYAGPAPGGDESESGPTRPVDPE
jgi:hypothetical protein